MPFLPACAVQAGHRRVHPLKRANPPLTKSPDACSAGSPALRCFWVPHTTRLSLCAVQSPIAQSPDASLSPALVIWKQDQLTPDHARTGHTSLTSLPNPRTMDSSRDSLPAARHANAPYDTDISLRRNAPYLGSACRPAPSRNPVLVSRCLFGEEQPFFSRRIQ
jgi:hypothetical protein